MLHTRPLFYREKEAMSLNRKKPVCLVRMTAHLIACLGASYAIAGDAAAGKARAGMCATCHGPLGISQLPNAPHLAGQPEIYTIEQLKQYRSGKRANEVMSVIAKPLSDTEIEDFAAWYGSIVVKVTEK
jgi:cytochrome c553